MLIRRRELSPVEITRAVVDRIERLNGRLGAYVLVHAERALKQAHQAEQSVMAAEPLGPLHGVPLSIKDNHWTAGDRTTSGSRLLADFVPPEDSPSVARLRAAGAIFVGRTNLPEFAWRGSTDNPLFGESRNPWDLTRTPGGSTGGGAAAVAAGLGPLALGSDGAGSIRIPASFCGLVGLKPTFGRVPMYPAAGAFAEIGVTVEEANPDLGDPSVILNTLYGGAQAGAHAARSPEQKAQMDPDLVAYAEASAGLSVVEYLRAVAARQAMVDALRRFFERYDLLLTPT